MCECGDAEQQGAAPRQEGAGGLAQRGSRRTKREGRRGQYGPSGFAAGLGLRVYRRGGEPLVWFPVDAGDVCPHDTLFTGFGNPVGINHASFAVSDLCPPFQVLVLVHKSLRHFASVWA